jgi:hypothetical protein
VALLSGRRTVVGQPAPPDGGRPQRVWVTAEIPGDLRGPRLRVLPHRPDGRIPLPRRLLAHLRRWKRRGQTFTVEWNGRAVKDCDKAFCHVAEAAGLSRRVLRTAQRRGILEGNPGGSLEATRRSFNKDFLSAGFKRHGAQAIEKLRKTQPAVRLIYRDRHGISVLPCVASWISLGRPCEKPQSFEQQSLRASRQLSVSLAATRAALLVLPTCCRTCHGI